MTESPINNLLANPEFRPALEVVRKVVFKRDTKATHIGIDDLRESLRFLIIRRRDARNFLQKILGKLPEPAPAEELSALLVVDNAAQAPLRFEEEAGTVFRQALLRFDRFLDVPEGGGRQRMASLYGSLLRAAERVPGQPAAARQAALSLALQMTEWPRTTPARLMLHGPEGCGTREMAAELATVLERSRYKRLHIDCSEFRSAGEAATLDGAKSYWSGSKPGEVTSFIHANPRAVIVFDNLDHTVPEVMKALRKPLVEGVMIDQFGLDPTSSSTDRSERGPQARTPVNCRQAIFLATVSEGSQWYDNPDLAALLNDPDTAQATMIEAMAEASQIHRGEPMAMFDPPVLHAFQNQLALLSPQRWDALREAARAGLKTALRRFRARLQCKLTVSHFGAVVDAHLLHLGPTLGLAATTPEAITHHLLETLAPSLLAQSAVSEAHIEVSGMMRSALSEILGKLGAEPIESLRKRRQFLHYQTTLESSTASTVSLRLEDCTLERTRRLADYVDKIHLEATVPNSRFADVAGHEDIKAFFREMLDYLRQPDRAHALQIDLPKGVVLHGPPGTGKTALARAFAGEAQLPIVAVAGTDLLHPHGLSELYRIAHAHAPCIVFIDEADALGRRGENGPGHDAAITKMLAEIQGYSARATVFHILATNRVEKLDAALLRPGRIDRRFHVGPLDRSGRAAMMDHLLAAGGLGDVHRVALVGLTGGMTGAEIEQVARESGLRRLRGPGAEALPLAAVRDEIETVKFGRRNPVRLNPVMRQRAAVHEIGHALCHALTFPHVPIEVVTITPRGGKLGFVRLGDDAQAHEETPSSVRDYIGVLLAGRAAEMIHCGDEGRSSGATADLSAATRAAWQAVAHAGLDAQMPEVSLMGFTEHDEAVPEALSRLAWSRTQAWLADAHEAATTCLRKHWPLVEQLSKILLQEDRIDGDELARLISLHAANRSAITGTATIAKLHEECPQ